MMAHRKPVYVALEEPDRRITIDYLGKFPASIKLELDEQGGLWVQVVGANDAAPVLLDEFVTIEQKDEV